MNPTVVIFKDQTENFLRQMLCGCLKERGWSIKSTSGRISKKNFIRSIGIEDCEGSWMNVRYTGLNFEGFNTVTVNSEHGSIALKIKKDSTMHNFLLDLFKHFDKNGGVMCS